MRTFHQQIIKHSGVGALFTPPDEAGFAPAVTKIFIDTKVRGHKTLGPKLLSGFDKKQGPGSHSAQASSSPPRLFWCDCSSCRESRTQVLPAKAFVWPYYLTSNVVYVCLTFVSWPDYLNPNGFGEHATIELCLFP